MQRLRRTAERGQAAVELALCLPVLALLLGGIFVFGQAYLEVQQLSGAVSEGARTAAFNASNTNRSSMVSSAITGASTRLDTSNLTVNAPTGTWAPGGKVTVSATYHLKRDFGPIHLDRYVTKRRTMRVMS